MKKNLILKIFLPLLILAVGFNTVEAAIISMPPLNSELEYDSIGTDSSSTDGLNGFLSERNNGLGGIYDYVTAFHDQAGNQQGVAFDWVAFDSDNSTTLADIQTSTWDLFIFEAPDANRTLFLDDLENDADFVALNIAFDVESLGSTGTGGEWETFVFRTDAIDAFNFEDGKTYAITIAENKNSPFLSLRIPLSREDSKARFYSTFGDNTGLTASDSFDDITAGAFPDGAFRLWVVPEPNSSVLFIIGLSIFFLNRKRKVFL